MRQCFFAYGSFAKNRVHYRNISNFICSEQAGFSRGEVYRLQCGYPVFSRENLSHRVSGVIYEMEVTENYWTILDELLGVDRSQPERSILCRESVPIITNDNGEIMAWTYCLNPQVNAQSLKKIPNGDWKQDLIENPPLPEYLESKHFDYITKLSNAKGRELVPYKLDVYRRLLSLEIIKDKGRRPALTSLGQEVSLFIK